ncbi:MAG: GNAT family N-acetyltransferase [Idiomarina sp.]|nr:GNAT family N-acetyltransferase [Idiomarina sp.]
MLKVITGLMLVLSTVVATLVAVPSHGAIRADSEAAPGAWDGQHWLITPMSVRDTNAYYQAYMSSPAYLYRALGWGWPTQKISPEMNRDMVSHHVEQHRAGESFTYVIRARGDRAIAGAVYINRVSPERRFIPNYRGSDFGAEATLWLAESYESHEGAEFFLAELLQWFEEVWSFQAVLFPINTEYSFLHEQFNAIEREAFAEDADRSELLYRFP